MRTPAHLAIVLALIALGCTAGREPAPTEESARTRAPRPAPEDPDMAAAIAALRPGAAREETKGARGDPGDGETSPDPPHPHISLRPLSAAPEPAAVAARSAPSFALVPLVVRDRAGVGRVAEPVTGGVPFPMGAIRDTAKCAVVDADGRAVPAQVRATGTWPDGSVRWALVDFQADVAPGADARYALRPDGAPGPAPPRPVKVEASGDAVVVDTGAARFTLSARAFRLFESVAVGGVEIVKPDAGSGVFAIGGVATGARTFSAALAPVELNVAEPGPLRAVVEVRGAHGDGRGGTHGRFTLRLSFFAGKSQVHAAYTVENPDAAVHPGNVWDLGSPGSRFFEDISLRVALPLRGEGETTRYEIGAETTIRRGSQGGGRTGIYQDSSGGVNWDLVTHLRSHDEIAVSFRGYRAFANGDEVDAGLRPAAPYLDISGPAGGVTVAIRHFWQSFPNGVDFDGGSGILSVRPFPGDSAFEHELQGGEHATKTILWYFHEGGAGVARAGEVARAFQDPLVPIVPAEHHAAARALGELIPPASDRFPEWEAWRKLWVYPCGPNPRTVLSQRETIDEYGWRNFGDAMADHETDCGTKSWDAPVSHFNNQYDGNLGCLVEFARTGDLAFLDMGAEGARHMADIDVYHAADGVYGGGHFWHTTHDVNAFLSTHRSFPSAIQHLDCTPYKSGGPGIGHVYIEGLLAYHHLSGDRKAREVALEVAAFTVRYYKGGSTRGPGAREAREAANVIRTCVSAHLETGDAAYLETAEDCVRAHAYPPRKARFELGIGMLGVALGRFVEHEVACGRAGSEAVGIARASLAAMADALAAHEGPVDVNATYISDTLMYACRVNPGHANAATWKKAAESVFRAIFCKPPTYSGLKPLAFMSTGGLLWPRLATGYSE